MPALSAKRIEAIKALVAAGFSNLAIAGVLGIDKDTVSKYDGRDRDKAIKCVACGAAFKPKKYNAATCSQKCLDARVTAYAAAYYTADYVGAYREANREKIRAASRRYEAKNRAARNAAQRAARLDGRRS